MPITFLIIIATVLFSIQGFKNKDFFYRFDFSPYHVDQHKEWFRFFTHAFLHGDWIHLFFNMFVLYMFGTKTQHYFEAYAGAKGIFYYILLYAGGIVFATLPTFKKHKHNPNYHSIGASGAVSAVLFSSVIFGPSEGICLYGVLCFPGIVWAIIYLAYSYYQAKKENDHINHDAHFWGAIFGVVFTIIVVPESFMSFIRQVGSLIGF